MRVYHWVCLQLKLIIVDPDIGVSCLLRLYTDTLRAVAHIDTVFLFTDVVHGGKNLLIAVQGHVAIRENIIHTWRLRQPGQKGCLSQGKFFRCGVEIRLCGRLNTVRQVAVINLVQVKFKDLILCVAPGDF